MCPDDFVDLVLNAYVNPSVPALAAFRTAGRFVATAPGGFLLPRLVVAAVIRRSRELEAKQGKATGDEFRRRWNAAFKTLIMSEWKPAQVDAWCRAFAKPKVTPPKPAAAAPAPPVLDASSSPSSGSVGRSADACAK